MIRKTHQTYRDRATKGYALIAVALAILGLSLIAGAILRYAVSNSFLAVSTQNRTQATYAALGAIDIFAFEAFANTAIDLSESIRVYDVNSATVVVDVSDEAGRIDLNQSAPEVLSAAAASLGQDSGAALELAAAIVDWRDTDDAITPGGAEASEYAAMSLNYSPRNGAMETTGEVLQVKGMTSALFSCLFEVVTVYADSSDVDFNVAPQAVRDVFEWGAVNSWQGYDWSIPPPPGPESSIQVIRSDQSGAELRLNITVQDIDSRDYQFTAIVRMSRSDLKPYELLAFHEFVSPDSEACT